MSSRAVERLRFLALDERNAAPLVRERLERLSGEDFERGRLVLAGCYAARGQFRQARKIAAAAKGRLRTDVGSAEFLNLRLTLLRDCGELRRSLANARAAVTLDFEDIEGWRIAHFGLALMEGASGNLQRARASWGVAAKSCTPIYRIGASVNLARDCISDGDFETAQSLLRQAGRTRVPAKLEAIRLNVSSRFWAEKGELHQALEFQERALRTVTGFEPLRVARHALALLELQLRSGQMEQASETIEIAKTLVFSLGDERQEVAAAALLTLVEAAMAHQISIATVESARRTLETEPNRWGRSSQGRG